MTIEGIPAGWELVRIGTASLDDWVIDNHGKPRQYDGVHATMSANYVIIRKLLTVEAGKYYRLVNGEVVGPMEEKNGGLVFEGCYWESNGNRALRRLGPTENIVEEVDAPKPKYIPWTRETCPLGGVISVYNRKVIIVHIDDTGCVAGRNYIRYEELLNSGWIYCGKPCGTEVTE